MTNPSPGADVPQRVELLPCPFCGSPADTNLLRKKSGWVVNCSMYCCSLGFRRTTKEAIAHWNTRATGASHEQE